MRDITFAVIMAIGIVAMCLCIARSIIEIQDQGAQLHNAYWPYSVEMQVRDR